GFWGNTIGCVCSGRRFQSVTTELSPQRLFVDLTRRPERHLLDHNDLIGEPPTGYPASQLREQLILCGALSGPQLYDQQRSLVALGVRYCDNRGQRDLGVCQQDVLDRDRADPLTTGLDQVLGPIGDLQIPAFVNARDVPRIEETVLI